MGVISFTAAGNGLRCDAGDIESDATGGVRDLLEQSRHFVDGGHELTHDGEVFSVPRGVFLQLAKVAGFQLVGGLRVRRRQHVHVGALFGDRFGFRREHVHEEQNTEADCENDHGHERLFAFGE